MLNLGGKVILITGATGALGQATAKIFYGSNANLILTGRDPSKLDQFADKFSSTRYIALPCDLTNEYEAERLIQQTLEHFGQIDCLLNLAGGFSMGPQVHELSAEDFDAMFQMNFVSTLNTCKRVIPQMIQQDSGRIVNVSARAATEGKGKMAPYCISKRAVVTLTESLAAEHKNDDININCILPGTIDTATNRADMPNADHASWVPPEDIANTMLYLSSDLANSVNGAIVPVYGKS